MKVDHGPQHLGPMQRGAVRGVEWHETKATEERAVARPNGRRADQVSLSPAAEELKRLYQALEAQPAQRAQRVAELREAVQNGTYEIPEDGLIERLLSLL